MQIDAAGQAEPGRQCLGAGRPQMLGADVGGIGDDQIVGAARGAGLQEIRMMQVQGQAGKAPGHALRHRREGVPVRIVAADLQGARDAGGQTREQREQQFAAADRRRVRGSSGRIGIRRHGRSGHQGRGRGGVPVRVRR